MWGVSKRLGLSYRALLAEKIVPAATVRVGRDLRLGLRRDTVAAPLRDGMDVKGVALSMLQEQRALGG